MHGPRESYSCFPSCVMDLGKKKKRPFTDSETMKECILAVVNEVIKDDKVKTSVTSAIKNVPVSDT